MKMSGGYNPPYMRQREPSHRRRERIEQAGRQKDVRWEAVCEGLAPDLTSWRGDKYPRIGTGIRPKEEED